MSLFDNLRRWRENRTTAPVPSSTPARIGNDVVAERMPSPVPPSGFDAAADRIADDLRDAPAFLDAATDAPSHDGPERREKARRNARPGTRMLVVDDSATIVALLRKMLQQNGYEVLQAEDAETGIEIARTQAPDLMFLDIVLPGMDGFTALRTLRRDPATRDLPIIMISGNAQATEQFYVQRIGADDFMKKPFSRAEVFARIERLLDDAAVPRRITARPGAA